MYTYINISIYLHRRDRDRRGRNGEMKTKKSQVVVGQHIEIRSTEAVRTVISFSVGGPI